MRVPQHCLKKETEDFFVQRRKINPLLLVYDIRSGLDDNALLEKYGLTRTALQYLLNRLVHEGFISEMEAYERTCLSESDTFRVFTNGKPHLKCPICGNPLPDDDGNCQFCTEITQRIELTEPQAFPLPEEVAGVSTAGGLRMPDNRLKRLDPAARPQVAVRFQDADYSATKALAKASGRGQLETVRKMLDQGVDVNSTTKYDNTPLMRSSFRGYADVTRLLLERGANVNSENASGNTALIVAASAGQSEVVGILLDCDADVNKRNIDGNSALMAAVEQNDIEMVQRLLEKGADADCRNNNDDTPLMRACEKSFIAAAALLLSRGGNPNIGNRFGNTALMKTALKGDADMVKALLGAGADVNARNIYGNTALMKAAFRGHREVLRLLLNTGADTGAEDNEGRNAEVWARRGGHNKTADSLGRVLRDRPK